MHLSPIVIVLLVVLIVLAIGGYPRFGYAPPAWGWYPSSGLGLIVVVLLILLLLGYL